ncbi:MAG: hypothetical protein ACRDJC_19885 [Thermomicrobiales bacterium]
MREHVFDEVARGTADALTRRRSLMTLGGAVLATAMAAPRPVQAGKNSKKAKKKCKRQEGQCVAFFENLCEQDECSPEELEAALACCSLLRTCKAGEYLECLFDAIF